MTDREIVDVLGKELGEAFLKGGVQKEDGTQTTPLKMQEFHDAVIEYEVLAGASLAAKRQMAQSLTLITQIFENPTIQNNLAEINGEYIDFKPILKMWMEASEWKNTQDIIKPLTPEMKQKIQQKSQAAQQQTQGVIQQQKAQIDFQNRSALEDQATDNRIKRDLVREAFRKDSSEEATEGESSPAGLEGGPEVV
jgi:hypothetical protein